MALWHAPPKRTFVGTAEQVADEIQRWFELSGEDGFNFFEALPNTSLKDFVALVVPLLQARGIYRTQYGQGTLRDNLDLPVPVPVNRYAVEKATAEVATANVEEPLA